MKGPHESVASLVTSDETAAYIVIAEHETGAIASQGAVDDESGSKEAKLLAEYISAVCQREGISREEYVREIVSELNEIPREVSK